ncbi:MAG: hypothetical protein AB7G11_02360 [Phycisphaerales bacterium]
MTDTEFNELKKFIKERSPGWLLANENQAEEPLAPTPKAQPIRFDESVKCLGCGCWSEAMYPVRDISRGETLALCVECDQNGIPPYRWTDQPPTEPTWTQPSWWCYQASKDRMHVLWITKENGRMMARLFRDQLIGEPIDHHSGQWSDRPIPLPRKAKG